MVVQDDADGVKQDLDVEARVVVIGMVIHDDLSKREHWFARASPFHSRTRPSPDTG